MIDFYGNLAEDKTVISTGSYNVSAPLQKSTVWVMQMATFRASAIIQGFCMSRSSSSCSSLRIRFMESVLRVPCSFISLPPDM